MDWDIGQNYQIVTISIDPAETSQRAQETKDKYLTAYGRPGVAESWHFLTGTRENIDKVASSVGFRYKYLHDTKQYAHPAVFMVATPDGRVSRYLYGIQFDADTVRMSLLEAGEGKIGSAADRVLLYCFQYDPRSGSYVPAAMNIMRAGGVLLMLLLGGLIGGLILVRRIRGGRAADPQTTDTASTATPSE
jgi:protein SCO1/2